MVKSKIYLVCDICKKAELSHEGLSSGRELRVKARGKGWMRTVSGADICEKCKPIYRETARKIFK